MYNKIESLPCHTPFCNNTILLDTEDFIIKDYIFCPECKDAHSPYVLKAQVEHEKPIREIILDAKIFRTVNGMAAYAGVSFVTMYNWIKKYFGLSFQEFRRTYICNSSKCYLLNIKRSSYSRNDYILKKIRSRRRYCACIAALAPDHIMTNCPPEEISIILRGYPKINRINDSLFALAPKSAHFWPVVPKYITNRPKMITLSNRPRMITSLNSPRPIIRRLPNHPIPIHYFERF